MTLLETEKLTRAYGGVVAVNKVDFDVEEGLITGLIGPNGAGKTTLFNNITGLDAPTHGRVIFEGKDTGAPAHKICRMGIARTPRTSDLQELGGGERDDRAPSRPGRARPRGASSMRSVAMCTSGRRRKRSMSAPASGLNSSIWRG